MDMRKCIYIILTVLAFTLYGCSDWLDVKPSDRVSEENAFSTLSGFKKALNGVYVELNQNELYGRSLRVCGNSGPTLCDRSRGFG